MSATVASPARTPNKGADEPASAAEIETHIALCDDVIKKYKGEGRLYDALQYMEKGLLLRKDLYGMRSESVFGCGQDLATAYNTVAMSLLGQGRADAALSLLKKADMLTEPKGPLSVNTQERVRLRSVTFNNLGCLYKKCGKLHAALQALEKALALETSTIEAVNANAPQKNLQGEEAFSLFANRSGTHLNICAILSQLDQHEAAYEHAQYALELLEEGQAVTGEDGGDVDGDGITDRSLLAVALHNVAVEQEALQMTADSIETYKQAADVALAQLGPDHPTTKTVTKSYKLALKNAKAPDAKTKSRPGTAGTNRTKTGTKAGRGKKRPTTASRAGTLPGGLLFYNNSQGQAVSAHSRKGGQRTRGGASTLASRKVASARGQRDLEHTRRPMSADGLSKTLGHRGSGDTLPRLDDTRPRPATARQRTHDAYASSAAHARIHQDNARRKREAENNADPFATQTRGHLTLPQAENGMVDGDALQDAVATRRRLGSRDLQTGQDQYATRPQPPSRGGGGMSRTGTRGVRTSAIMKQYDGLFNDVLNKSEAPSYAAADNLSDVSEQSRQGAILSRTDRSQVERPEVVDITISGNNTTRSKSRKPPTSSGLGSTRRPKRKPRSARSDYAWVNMPTAWEDRNQSLAGEIRLGPTPPERIPKENRKLAAGIRKEASGAVQRPTPSQNWRKVQSEFEEPVRRTAAHMLRAKVFPPGTRGGGGEKEDAWALIAYPRERDRLELVIPCGHPHEVEQAASTIQAAFRVYLARKWWWRQTKRRAAAKRDKHSGGSGGNDVDSDDAREHVLKGMSKEALISLADSIMKRRKGQGGRDRRSARAEHALIKIWQLGSARVRALAHSRKLRKRTVALPPSTGLIPRRSGPRTGGSALDRPMAGDDASDIGASEVEHDPRLAFRRGRRRGAPNGNANGFATADSASDYGAADNDSAVDEFRRDGGMTRSSHRAAQSGKGPVWRRTAANKIIVGPQAPPRGAPDELLRPSRPAILHRVASDPGEYAGKSADIPRLVSTTLSIEQSITELHDQWFVAKKNAAAPPPVPQKMLRDASAPLTPQATRERSTVSNNGEGQGLNGPNSEYWEHVQEFSRLASKQGAEQHELKTATESSRQRMIRQRKERRAQQKSVAQEKADLVERTAAVVLIQRLFKGWKLRSRFQAKREAAITLQAAVRGHLTRIHLFRAKHLAATKIQAAYRGYVDRHRVALLREDLALRNGSATKIQAMVRGMLVRRKWPQIKVTLVADKRKRWAAAISIQTVFRAYFCRKLLAQGLKAALDIQRVWRGHLGREKTRAERRKHHAARDIQRVFRGSVDRTKVNVLKSAIAAERKGANALQALFRGYVARRRVAAIVARRTDAAIKIQSIWRSQLATREVAVRRAKRQQRHEAAINIQRVAKGRIQRNDYQRRLAEKRRREKAATTIQSGFRGMAGRQEAGRRRAQRQAQHDKAATQIQRVFRGKQGRDFATRMKDAAERIKQIKPQTIGHVWVMKKAPSGNKRTNTGPPKSPAVNRRAGASGARGRRPAQARDRDMPPSLHFDAYMKDTMRLAHEVVVSVAEAERVLAAFSELPIVGGVTDAATNANAQAADDNTKMRARDIRALLYTSIDRADGVLDTMHSAQESRQQAAAAAAADADLETPTSPSEAVLRGDPGPRKLAKARRNPRTMAIIQTQQDYRARRNAAYQGPPGQIVEQQSQRQSIADELNTAIRAQEEKERAARDARRAKEVARLDWQERQLREWKILSSSDQGPDSLGASGSSARSQAIARVARERVEGNRSR